MILYPERTMSKTILDRQTYNDLNVPKKPLRPLSSLHASMIGKRYILRTGKVENFTEEVVKVLYVYNNGTARVTSMDRGNTFLCYSKNLYLP